MINREILYDRNVTGSYMKIPMGLNPGLDEKLILKRKLSGTLSVEKTYVDGNGQYWYNISGKQSLDTYCRVNRNSLCGKADYQYLQSVGNSGMEPDTYELSDVGSGTDFYYKQ